MRRGAQYLLRNALSGGRADESFVFGRSTDAVLVGDWNADGKDTLVLRRPPAAPARPAATAPTAPRTSTPVRTSVAPSGSSCPAAYPIKGNVNSKGERIYHTTSSRTYNRTNPEQCFATAADAARAGYRAARD